MPDGFCYGPTGAAHLELRSSALPLARSRRRLRPRRPERHGQAPATTFTYHSAELTGKILAFDADTAVLEASGGFREMTRSAGTWSEQAFLPAPGDPGDSLDATASLDGDTLLIGAPHERSNATGVNENELDNSLVDAGAAYAFVRTGTAWSQEAYLKASNTKLLFLFGESVSLSGDIEVARPTCSR